MLILCVLAIFFAGVHGQGSLPLRRYEWAGVGEAIHRQRRDASSVGVVINLRLTDGREFKLSLSPSADNQYRGSVIDDHRSFVSGSIVDGLFVGKICTSTMGCKYVEPSKRFFNSTNEDDIPSLVVYSPTDVVQVSRTELEETQAVPRIKRNLFENERSTPHSTAFPGNRSCCYMYIRTDPFLWTEVFKREGQRSARTTELFILNLVHQVVDGANEIFRKVAFSRPATGHTFKGFQLKIKRIKIIRPSDCNVTDTVDNLLCQPHMDVLNFLHAHSEQNFSEYCLAYTFTARDFVGGTLGLAWSGKIDLGRNGGICYRPVRPFEKYRGYNGGIITVLNYGTRVSMRTLELTFAHEVGHNLGAEHDPDSGPCAPSSREGGNYLMYSKAISANEVNNDKFSACSLQDIGELMVAMVLSELKYKANCLEVCEDEFCGNRVLEKDEDCDCGFEEDCRKIGDNCCEPADADISVRCKLKSDAICSRSQGSCCSKDCKPEPTTHLCYRPQGQDCLKDTYCSGISPECPVNDSKYFRPDKSFCDDFTGICRRGRCVGSICELQDAEQCFLSGDIKSYDMEKRKQLCHLGCRPKYDNTTCVDTFHWDGFIHPATGLPGFWLRKGSSCADSQGYCDVFDVCRPVDNEGPLTRLAKTLFNKKNMHSLRKLIEKYWWAVLLAICAFIMLSACLLRVCSVHTKSSNPFVEQRRPHRSL